MWHGGILIRLQIYGDFMNPRFERGIPDLKGESQILWKISIHINVLHRKVHLQNPMLKSLNSMPAY